MSNRSDLLVELRDQLDAIERQLADVRERLDQQRAELRASTDGETLERVEAMHDGGTVAYRVTLGGQRVGWVGDGAPWRGWRYGGRRWWACWRQDGDTAARWSSELEYPTRKRALTALLLRAGGVADV